MPSCLVFQAAIGSPPCSSATQGTASATPLRNESTQFDGARRSLSLQLAMQHRRRSLFLSSLRHFSRSPLRSCSFIPVPPSLSPPSVEHARARARAQSPPCLSLLAFSASLPFSRSHLPPSYPRGRFSVISRPRRAPHSHSVRSTPAFLPRRRSSAGASPSRITPRPRERSVTTKVLVKS